MGEYKCGRCGAKTFRPCKAYGPKGGWVIAVRLCKECQAIVAEADAAAVKRMIEREVSTAFVTLRGAA